jgi:hypothetical protein
MQTSTGTSAQKFQQSTGTSTLNAKADNNEYQYPDYLFIDTTIYQPITIILERFVHKITKGMDA